MIKGLSFLKKQNLINEYKNQSLNFCKHMVYLTSKQGWNLVRRQRRVRLYMSTLMIPNRVLSFIHEWCHALYDFDWWFLKKNFWQLSNGRQWIERKVKHLWIYNGLKFYNSKSNNLYSKKGILRHCTYVATPQ